MFQGVRKKPVTVSKIVFERLIDRCSQHDNRHNKENKKEIWVEKTSRLLCNGFPWRTRMSTHGLECGFVLITCSTSSPQLRRSGTLDIFSLEIFEILRVADVFKISETRDR